jgi:hypothetical protein
MQYQLRDDIFARSLGGGTREDSALETISSSSPPAKVLCHYGFCRLLRGCFTRHAQRRQAKSRTRSVWEFSMAIGERVGVIQALFRNAMRFSSITIALSQCARRFGAAGLFLLASLAFDGNDSPMLGRSVSVDRSKTNSPLSRGATSFIIRLTDPARERRFTFVNENAAAEGQLSIAVSNHSLAADSPKWSTVEGAIRFRHKRLFLVSLVGVEANYVRLTFRVEVPDGNGSNDFSRDHPRRKDPAAPSASALLRGLTAEQPLTTATLRP